MSPLLLGALVAGGVSTLVLVSGSQPRDPSPTPGQLSRAVAGFKGLTIAQKPAMTSIFKVGTLVFESTAPAGPTEPDAGYVLQLLKFAARSSGAAGKARRSAAVAEGELAVINNDAPRIWSLLWQLTRQGLYGRGSSIGMSQSKRDEEINSIVVNLLAYELYWRRTSGESFAKHNYDRVRNLMHRYQYIVSRIGAPKVRVKYGKRLASKVFKGCGLTMWRGPSWGKFITGGGPVDGIPFHNLPGMIVAGNVTVTGVSAKHPDCDTDAVLLKLAAQVAYVIGQLAVLSINAKAYVGYGFGDLMAGITMVGQAFTAVA